VNEDRYDKPGETKKKKGCEKTHQRALVTFSRRER